MCYIMISLPAPLAPVTRLAVRHFLVREKDRLGPLLDVAAAVQASLAGDTTARFGRTRRARLAKLRRLISDLRGVPLNTWAV